MLLASGCLFVARNRGGGARRADGGQHWVEWYQRAGGGGCWRVGGFLVQGSLTSKNRPTDHKYESQNSLS